MHQTCEGEDEKDRQPQEEVEFWLSERNWVVAELESDPGADIHAIISGSPQLASDASRQIARKFLRAYASDVFAVPASLIGQSYDVWIETTTATQTTTSNVVEVRVVAPTEEPKKPELPGTNKTKKGPVSSSQK